MMYWNESWSGVRAMLADWRLPESWTGPNFWVAPAGHGAPDSITKIATAAVRQRIDISPSMAKRCVVGSLARNARVCNPTRRVAGWVPATRRGPLLPFEESLAPGQDER